MNKEKKITINLSPKPKENEIVHEIDTNKYYIVASDGKYVELPRKAVDRILKTFKSNK